MNDAEEFDELARKQGHWGGGFMAKRAMAADKDALFQKFEVEQPAQEPVALVIDGVLVKSALPEKYTGHLYTAPPQRPWVELTEEDFSAINQSCLTKLQAATSAESILKKKNS